MTRSNPRVEAVSSAFELIDSIRNRMPSNIPDDRKDRMALDIATLACNMFYATQIVNALDIIAKNIKDK